MESVFLLFFFFLSFCLVLGVGEEVPTWREERLASSSVDVLEWLEVAQTAG